MNLLWSPLDSDNKSVNYYNLITFRLVPIGIFNLLLNTTKITVMLKICTTYI